MTSRGKRLRWALLLASIMAVVALSTPAATTDPCAQTYKGISAASEPEQQALQTLFTQLFPDQKGAPTDPVPTTARGSFITIHSYGNLVLLPPGAGGTTRSSFTLNATLNNNASGNAAGSVGRPPAQNVAAGEYYLDTPPW